MILMGYSGTRGTLIYEKNLMSKISCQTPFKGTGSANGYNYFLYTLIDRACLNKGGGWFLDF
jgi:hypothetical protein